MDSHPSDSAIPTRAFFGGGEEEKTNLFQGESTTIMIRVPGGRIIVAMSLAVVCRRRSRELERKMNTAVSSCSLHISITHNQFLTYNVYILLMPK